MVKGNIFETLPHFLERNSALRIALLHIDVDVYEPSKFILEQLWERVVRGGIVMLDDYATIEGETRAVDEFFADKIAEFRKPPFSYIPTYIVKQ